MLVTTFRLENGYRGEDRLLVAATPAGLVAVVADGAGGAGGAGAAAQAICDVVASVAANACGDANRWVAALREADQLRLRVGGQSTAVIVEVFNNTVLGASVGDSGALLIQSNGVVDLTGRQERKPLIGSGASSPIAFGPLPMEGRLLLATDGLMKYVRPAILESACRVADLELAADSLLKAAQLPNGKYQDDIAIVVLQLAA